VLRETLAALPIAYDKFAFVDCGSGKGRTLLIASEFPFKFIIGVEFAAEPTAQTGTVCEACPLKVRKNRKG
jgi:hypothetical protein